jgi:hypothetical protein
MKNDDDGFKATYLKIPISPTGAFINSIKMFKIDTINGSSFDLFPLCIPPAVVHVFSFLFFEGGCFFFYFGFLSCRTLLAAGAMTAQTAILIFMLSDSCLRCILLRQHC